MKKILVLHTGGTIAMKEDAVTGGVSPDVANPLMDATISIPTDVKLVVEDIFNLPSPHITPRHMLKIKERIQFAKSAGIDSIVITHGTDTLEETAFFLDTTIGNQLPIVITGAMRSSNELGSDGLYNFESAIRVAACPEAQDKGVLVVMNDEIHSARYVTKTHTTNVATFRTPTLGPIGLVSKHRILFMQQLVETPHWDVSTVDGLIPIVKAYAGMHGDLFEALVQTEIDGLVIEALGAGNLPPETLAPLQKMLDKQIPVVLVSRCFNGIAEPVYDYQGGGSELQKMGVIFCNSINSQKARIKLLIAKNCPLSPEELSYFMEN
ncbi:asparaginase [Enterococcus saccharolyticus]|uniref:asparaginase n=1 Tax=Enterococcus saccharolyticus subsp. saccharolyticus ATCC 43076 TaxID=1139996 RepID=S0NG53_9ENTE|nr:asparaginase [Enterococcus saccharolyticus]EOT29865.1 L-asparaginase [Enterococcus saccharolyticus subsp. saccharolyticus ATCC 43076]EOT80412.1 L-asparaginase [Enterococcus saccharolyticus subsp. saccharolyticus ATCC 43076]OJG88235.1 L-asparaginase [Enterococcus saccharolyticus]